VEVWDFWQSLFFCATVYTTIGYGNFAPVTKAGRVATIIYALVGIPLCLVVMADFGRLFTRILKFFWAFVRRFYYTGSCQKIVDAFVVDDEFNLPPIIAVVITLLYIMLGAAVLIQWEDWDYLESFYFVFISISTIGFGDVLPDHPKRFMAAFVYLLFGLSLVAML
ncbi:TWiK family of potassium channels protein 18, partial [Lamellibrachia satsuma]